MSRRRNTQLPKQLTLCEFIKSKLVDLETEYGTITLGTLINGVWQEYIKGEEWDTVRCGSIWDESQKFVSFYEMVREYEVYKENFEMRGMFCGAW
jgi:hypothetical protein